MNNQIKILTNVFINTDENNIVPVNIYFDETIQKIEKISSQGFKWDDVNSIQKKQKVVNAIHKNPLPDNCKIIEGAFNLLIPGAIDPHVHFNTPGFEFRDTFEHGTTAAAFGGVTTIIDMPCTSLPPVTSLENFNVKLNSVKNRAIVDFAFWGGVCRNDFENKVDIEKNINELNEAGVAAFKTYLISGMETFKDLNLGQMKAAAKLISKTGKPMGVHAEDKKIIETRREKLKKISQNKWKHYCIVRDSIAEEIAVKDMANISQTTGAKIHIVHLSSELGLDVVRNAIKEGINISAETCSHYLQFTQDDFNNNEIRNFLKTAPPVKKENDKIALWSGLKDNTLNFVTTDHAGCNPLKEKTSENFWEIYGGIPGVEHRVTHLLSEGFKKNRLTLKQTINLLSTNAAEFFNLRRKGKIAKGYHADFALLDMWHDEIVNSNNMHSKGKYTPFEGLEFNCKVEKTILRGSTVMDRTNKVEKSVGYGKFIEVH